uniref:Uncharacterized protein n=1 Tax=Daphnia magna TaxID=35525 RepID=A0A0N8EJD2_9CRUS
MIIDQLPPLFSENIGPYNEIINVTIGTQNDNFFICTSELRSFNVTCTYRSSIFTIYLHMAYYI